MSVIDRDIAAPSVPAIVAQRLLLRALAIAVLGLAIVYFGWRLTSSVNWRFWWFAVPLLVAELYSAVDTCLFALTMWRIRDRGEPPPPARDVTVDVFVTRYDEPVELLRRTTRAARDISYPHRTYVLDDGDSSEVAAMAAEEGVEYVTRGEEWRGRPRHAKAGNLSNALLRTHGQFILVLDADQVPEPHILDRTLGYFGDPKVALVQTPQDFANVPRRDPLGSRAPLFYGPIQKGKDGWNAAFYCGSNAVLRRDALLQAGVAGYVRELTGRVRRVLRAASRVLARSARRARRDGDERAYAALTELAAAVADAEAARRRGEPIQEFTYAFQRRADEVSRRLVAEDLQQIRSDLATIARAAEALQEEAEATGMADGQAVAALAGREWSPLGAIDAAIALVRAIDVDRSHEAQPILPLSTISVTEDMATALRLHAMGWSSVYVDEQLAWGLAPEDLRGAFRQRLRWAQGTIQVLLRENPLVIRGLSVGQRLMYLATIWSYLSGVFTVVYVVGPPLYLLFGVTPVLAYSTTFFWHLLPYLLASHALFAVAAWGRPTWRGQQYSLSLFPLWVQALWNALANVVLRRELVFLVTPKVPQGGPRVRLVWPQLVAMGLLLVAVLWGMVRLIRQDPSQLAILANLFWACYLLALLSVVLIALARSPARGAPAGTKTPA